MAEFNNYANPKIETKRFKIYADVSASDSPEWEIQGRGVSSWTEEQNSSINKENDVLGYVDMEREPSQPTQTGVEIMLRKGSKFAEMLFDAFFNRDYSRLDSVKMLQKFEFVDAEEEGSCLARLENEVMIDVKSFTGEAGSYLGFTIDIHYANKTTIGSMPKVDGETITFTPATAA